MGYLPEMWHDFGVAVAGLAGALTGLLFVAVSIKSDVLGRSRSLAFRAVLVGAAGLTFLLKAGGGLYWMIPAVLAGLVGGVINAWLFLVRVPASAEDDREE